MNICLEELRRCQRIEAVEVVLPDVFAPAWQGAIDEVARQLCTPRRQCRELVGYFTDNELGWGQPQTNEILGARFGVPPGAAVLAEFKPPWMDVVSANNYRRTMWERIDHYHQGQGMPVLIGEFAWAAPPFTDRSHQTAAERALPVADVVRTAGTATLQRAAAHPTLVGYTWYRWVQDPEPTGIGYGLVDRKDDPVRFNVELLTELNGRLDSIVRQPRRAAGS
jgi:hypothetical protein